MKGRTFIHKESDNPGYEKFHYDQMYQLIMNKYVMVPTVAVLFVSNVLNGTVFCLKSFCVNSFSFTFPIVLGLAFIFPEVFRCKRMLRAHPSRALKVFILSIVLSFYFVASDWPKDFSYLPLMSYIVVISLLVGFWPTLDNFESTFSSILLGCLSFLLFKGNLEVSDIGLLVGTLAACATGSAVNITICGSNFLQYKLSSANSLIMDSITKKEPLEIERIMPSKKPKHERLCIMFVDIIGFTMISKVMGKERVLKIIAEFNTLISEITYKHGGKIDRSLGDGVLAVFNSSVEGINAASDIQRSVTVRAVTHKLALFARIGLHTADVISGNIGGKYRLDFTVLGDGVIFAKRLESACNSKMVLLSSECYGDVPEIFAQKWDCRPIRFQEKHNSETLTGYELNPFSDSPNVLSLSDKLYIDAISEHREEIRFDFRGSCFFKAMNTEFEVLNISLSGFLLESPELYAPGFQFCAIFDPGFQDPGFRKSHLDLFELKVVWSRYRGKRYEMGVVAIGKHPRQKRNFIRSLVAAGILNGLKDLSSGKQPA